MMAAMAVIHLNGLHEHFLILTYRMTYARQKTRGTKRNFSCRVLALIWSSTVEKARGKAPG